MVLTCVFQLCLLPFLHLPYIPTNLGLGCSVLFIPREAIMIEVIHVVALNLRDESRFYMLHSKLHMTADCVQNTCRYEHISNINIYLCVYQLIPAQLVLIQPVAVRI